MKNIFLILLVCCCCVATRPVAAQTIPAKLDSLLDAYAKVWDYSGSVLVATKAGVVFEKAMGIRIRKQRRSTIRIPSSRSGRSPSNSLLPLFCSSRRRRSSPRRIVLPNISRTIPMAIRSPSSNCLPILRASITIPMTSYS